MGHDNYTKFYFNNLMSDKFKIIVTNKHDLKMNLAPSFKDSFTSPSYGQVRYYEGTTFEKQDFPVNCVAINITKQEWRAITEWLSPLTVGPLSFPWNGRHYYMAKVTSAPSGEMWVKSKVDNILEETYNVTFNVTFSTVGDWAALGQMTTIDLMSTAVEPQNFNNEYYLPFTYYTKKRELVAEKWYNNLGLISIDKTAKLTITAYISNQKYELIFDKGKLTFKGEESSFNDKYYLHFGPNATVFFSNVDEVNSLDNYDKLYITNPGSSFMYPNIHYYGKGFEVKYNDTTVESYEVAENPQYTSYIGKQGYITSKGRFIQEDSGLNFNRSSIKSNALSLPSGKPEILKVKNIKNYKFKTTRRFSQSRDKGYVVVVFPEMIRESSNYGTDIYGINQYAETINYDDFIIFYNPIITIDEDEYTVTITPNLDSNCNRTPWALKQDKYYFISICDIEELKIDKKAGTEDDKFYIDLQTRDVL